MRRNLSDIRITHYHTIQNFNDPVKTLLEKEKMLLTTFSPFPTMFTTLFKSRFNFKVTFILSSANAFNLGMSKT